MWTRPENGIDAMNELDKIRQSETYKNVQSAVNGGRLDDPEFAFAFANNHRTLQQNMMRFCIRFIEEMALHQRSDDRNEESVKLAKFISEKLKESGEYNYLPFI